MAKELKEQRGKNTLVRIFAKGIIKAVPAICAE